MAQRSPTDIQKRTFEFSVRVIRLVDKLPRTLAATEVGKQLLRSGTSVGAKAAANLSFVHLLICHFL